MSARRAKTTASRHVQCQSTARAWHLHPKEATPGSHDRGLSHAPQPTSAPSFARTSELSVSTRPPPGYTAPRYTAVIGARLAWWYTPSTAGDPIFARLTNSPIRAELQNPSPTEK